MKLDEKMQSWIISIVFALVFGFAMTFWGMGKHSEDKLIPFLLYTLLFALLHRMLGRRWR